MRDVCWRYLRYADGSEELYDLQVEANEWRNLAAEPAHVLVTARLVGALPKAESVRLPIR